MVIMFHARDTLSHVGVVRGAEKIPPIPFVAIFLAWLIPGAGHIYIGKVRRGIIVFLVIGATFWSGVAVGGVMTVDYQSERWWFVAEMLTGVHGLIGWHRQQRIYDGLAADENIGPPVSQRSPQRPWWQAAVDDKLAEQKIALVYPTDTVARAYAGIAGLLNLMCAFDALILAMLGVSGRAAGNEKKIKDISSS